MRNLIYLAAAMHIALCSVILPFWMTMLITAGMFIAKYIVIGNLTTNPKRSTA